MVGTQESINTGSRFCSVAEIKLSFFLKGGHLPRSGSTAFIQKSSTLGPGGRGYYELYAVRNKTRVLKFARVDAMLDLRLYIKNGGYAAQWCDMKNVL